MHSKLSVPPEDIPSTSVNFPCGWETFIRHLSTFRSARRTCNNSSQISVQLGDLLSTSVHFLCGQETYHQLPLVFHVAGKLFVSFHLLSVLPGELPSAFYAGRRTAIGLHQISVPLGDFPSISLNILCSREIFCYIPSLFSMAGRPSVNFCQLSVRP